MRNSNNQGTLRVYTYVTVTDIHGNEIRRKVSLGTNWVTELEPARDTMERVRADNRNLQVFGEFKIKL